MPKRFVVAASRFSDLPRFPAGLDLAEALTSAAQRLHETSTPDGALDTAVRLAVDLVPGAEHAGISAIERGNRRSSLAWTDEVVRTAEADGDPGPGQQPYWHRLWTSPVVEVADSESGDGDTALSALGLRSVLSLRLRADRRRLTVLTAYARKPRAFDEAGAFDSLVRASQRENVKLRDLARRIVDPPGAS